MAQNTSLSLNGALTDGISDGYVKKCTPDRGGLVGSAPDEAQVKEDLNTQYRAVYVSGGLEAARLTEL